MAPPEAPANTVGQTPPAVSVCASDAPAKLTILKKRADFLALNRARRQAAPSLLVQGRDRRDDSDAVRVGFTCSKKVGNAVARNRAKRRLREAARAVLGAEGRAGWDYALIGRAEVTAARPFPDLVADLRKAVQKLHGAK